MAKYMVSWVIPSDKRNEAISRFVDGTALKAPEGVSLVTRWHSVGGRRGWSVVETDNPAAIMDWLLSWTDLILYDVDPVTTDEEFGALLAKHGLG